MQLTNPSICLASLLALSYGAKASSTQDDTQDCDQLCKQRQLAVTAVTAANMGISLALEAYQSYEWCAEKDWCENSIKGVSNMIKDKILTKQLPKLKDCDVPTFLDIMSRESQRATYWGANWGNQTFAKPGRIDQDAWNRLNRTLTNFKSLPKTSFVDKQAFDRKWNDPATEPEQLLPDSYQDFEDPKTGAPMLGKRDISPAADSIDPSQPSGNVVSAEAAVYASLGLYWPGRNTSTSTSTSSTSTKATASTTMLFSSGSPVPSVTTSAYSLSTLTSSGSSAVASPDATTDTVVSSFHTVVHSSPSSTLTSSVSSAAASPGVTTDTVVSGFHTVVHSSPSSTLTSSVSSAVTSPGVTTDTVVSGFHTVIESSPPSTLTSFVSNAATSPGTTTETVVSGFHTVVESSPPSTLTSFVSSAAASPGTTTDTVVSGFHTVVESSPSPSPSSTIHDPTFSTSTYLPADPHSPMTTTLASDPDHGLSGLPADPHSSKSSTLALAPDTGLSGLPADPHSPTSTTRPHAAGDGPSDLPTDLPSDPQSVEFPSHLRAPECRYDEERKDGECQKRCNDDEEIWNGKCEKKCEEDEEFKHGECKKQHEKVSALKLGLGAGLGVGIPAAIGGLFSLGKYFYVQKMLQQIDSDFVLSGSSWLRTIFKARKEALEIAVDHNYNTAGARIVEPAFHAIDRANRLMEKEARRAARDNNPSFDDVEDFTDVFKIDESLLLKNGKTLEDYPERLFQTDRYNSVTGEMEHVLLRQSADEIFDEEAENMERLGFKQFRHVNSKGQEIRAPNGRFQRSFQRPADLQPLDNVDEDTNRSWWHSLRAAEVLEDLPEGTVIKVLKTTDGILLDSLAQPIVEVNGVMVGTEAIGRTSGKVAFSLIPPTEYDFEKLPSAVRRLFGGIRDILTLNFDSGDAFKEARLTTKGNFRQLPGKPILREPHLRGPKGGNAPHNVGGGPEGSNGGDGGDDGGNGPNTLTTSVSVPYGTSSLPTATPSTSPAMPTYSSISSGLGLGSPDPVVTVVATSTRFHTGDPGEATLTLTWTRYHTILPSVGGMSTMLTRYVSTSAIGA